MSPKGWNILYTIISPQIGAYPFVKDLVNPNWPPSHRVKPYSTRISWATNKYSEILQCK